jgi:peptidoglycan/LPS O-acetylase OafA/YrhL
MAASVHTGSFAGGGAYGRLGQLGDLRGLAAGLVFLCHCGVAIFALEGLAQSPEIFVLGRVGVAVFFIISGYVIYRPFAAGRPDLWGYAVRRVVRIVPAYWTVLAIAAVAVPAAVGHVTGADFGFAQIYSTATFGQGLGPAWTLCIEMTFYAFVPALAALMRTLGSRRARLEPWIIVALAGCSAAIRIAYPSSLISESLLGYFGWFAPGMLLAVVSPEYWSRVRLALTPALSWIAAAVLYLLLAPQIGTDIRPLSGSMLQYLGFALVAVLIAMPVFQAHRGASRAGRWLGDRSYGIYLWHFPVLVALSDWTGRGFNPVGYLFAAVALTLLAAHASYTLLERPLMKRAAAACARRRARGPSWPPSGHLEALPQGAGV